MCAVEACGLSAVPVCCYFSSLLLMQKLHTASKERRTHMEYNHICAPSLALPGRGRNQTTVFPVNLFPALKLESHSEAAMALPTASPSSLSGPAPRLHAHRPHVMHTCARPAPSCAWGQTWDDKPVFFLKKTTTQSHNYSLHSFTIWEQKSRSV